MSFTLTAGSIVEVTFPQRLHGQRILNVIHYKALNSSNPNDGDNVVEALVANLTSVNGIRGQLRALQTNQLDYENVMTQVIAPARRARVEHLSTSITGALPVASAPPNLQLTIVKRGALSGKHNVGALRVAGLPNTSQALGKWHDTLTVDMQAVADLLPVSVQTGTVEFVPVILNRSAPLTSVQITSTAIKEEVRTQRSRTLGRGD